MTVPSRKRLRTSHSPSGFREAMAAVPTLISVITTDGQDGPVGCTANAVLSVSTQPPTLLVSLGCRGQTAAAALEWGRFAVNVLGWHQRRLIDQFAGGSQYSRFAGVAYHRRHGVPVLDRCAVTITCDLDRAVELLDHVLLVGTVTSADSAKNGASLVLCGRQPHPLDSNED